ncbi:MAG: NAD-dependent epimerase/dehydratase family protein [Acidobacteriota bacterium]
MSHPASRWRILIAGCGFVGQALGRRLAPRGHRIWGIRRTPGPPVAGIEAITADLARPLDPDLLPSSPDFIVYLVSSKSRSDEAYRTAHVDGLSNLITGLTLAGTQPTRLLVASSTGVYPHSAGEWVAEETPVKPTDTSSRRLCEGEALALSAPFPATVVRFAGIYGAGRIRLLRRIARGEPTCAEGPPEYSNRIHVEDCAAVLEHLMRLDSPHNLYVASDDEPVDRCELAGWLADALGVPPADPLPRTAGPARGNKRCSNRRLKQSGYRFLFPTFREGYRQIIEAGCEI